jgi:DNA-binding transcriptional LysR family regulator
MDFSDRQVKLIEEGIDLSVRITRQAGRWRRGTAIGSSRLHVVAAPEYLARHGRPQHPAELIHHECLGYTAGNTPQQWQFMVDGQLQAFPVRSRTHANNGDVLVEAAAQGMGITLQPDFIIERSACGRGSRSFLATFPCRNWASTPCCLATAISRTGFGC